MGNFLFEQVIKVQSLLVTYPLGAAFTMHPFHQGLRRERWSTSHDQARAAQLHAEAQNLVGVNPPSDSNNDIGSAVNAVKSTISSTRARTKSWVSSLLGAGGFGGGSDSEDVFRTGAEDGADYHRARALSSPSASQNGWPSRSNQADQSSDVRSLQLPPVSSLVLRNEASDRDDALSHAGSRSSVEQRSAPKDLSPRRKPVPAMRDFPVDGRSLAPAPLLSPDEVEAKTEADVSSSRDRRCIAPGALKLLLLLQLENYRLSGEMSKEESAVLSMLDAMSNNSPYRPASAPLRARALSKLSSDVDATPRPPLRSLPALMIAKGVELKAQEVLPSPTVSLPPSSSPSLASSIVTSIFSPVGHENWFGRTHHRGQSLEFGTSNSTPDLANAAPHYNFPPMLKELRSPMQGTPASTPGLGPSGQSSPKSPMGPKRAPWARESALYGLAIRNASSQDEAPLTARIRADARPPNRRMPTQWTAATSVVSDVSSEHKEKSSYSSGAAAQTGVHASPKRGENTALRSTVASKISTPASSQVGSAASSVAWSPRSSKVARSLPPTPSKTRELIGFFDDPSARVSSPCASNADLPRRSPSPSKTRSYSEIDVGSSLALSRSPKRAQLPFSSHATPSPSALSARSAMSRSTEFGRLPLDTSGAVKLLPAPRGPISLTDHLSFLDLHSDAALRSSGPVKLWVKASVALLSDALAVSWLPAGGGRENVAFHLNMAKRVRSLPSSEIVGAEHLYPFEIVFDEGSEILAAAGPLDRIKWVNAIE